VRVGPTPKVGERCNTCAAPRVRIVQLEWYGGDVVAIAGLGTSAALAQP
jgi:hypothetical protein